MQEIRFLENETGARIEGLVLERDRKLDELGLLAFDLEEVTAEVNVVLGETEEILERLRVYDEGAEGLWYELRSHGVEVVACCAGAMRTPGYIRSFDRDVPGMLSPDEAARRTLDGLGRGPRLVPGVVNRMTAVLTGRLLPRRWAVRLIGRNTKHVR